MDKTPLQQVKQMLEDDVTPKAILSWIESTGEAVERDAIVEAHKADDPFNNIHDAEQYYETRYGSSFK